MASLSLFNRFFSQLLVTASTPSIFWLPIYWLLRGLFAAISLALAALVAALLGLLALYAEIEPQLPDVNTLREFKYQVPLSIYTRDGQLMAQFGDKKRIPTKYETIPLRLIQAVLSAEDDRFFDHPGVDYQGLLRAALRFAKTGEKRQGGSTITMQVARNFFLSSEKTFMRKLKEIFLALKIERELSKKDILELYLNKIYLGHHAYGVGAAAQVYFGKTLAELDLAQIALLAGLPKAPSQYNPFLDPNKAMTRRSFVLQRMRKLNYITEEELQDAQAQSVPHEAPPTPIEFDSPYMAEMVRAYMYERYGEEAYDRGYKVYTTLDRRLQTLAEQSLRIALHDYDEKHGYRAPVIRLDSAHQAALSEKFASLDKLGDTVPALVTSVAAQSVQAKLKDGNSIELDWDSLKWARRQLSENQQGAYPHSAKDILKVGDIIRVRPGTTASTWRLAQVPAVEGALVALAPDDGAILAMVGGFDFYHSKYNRVTQARRQPGSGFKPLVYLTALEQGYTLSSLLNDAPFVYVDPWQNKEWRPHNYSNRYNGPIRLREALIHSSNLATVHLANTMGIDKVIDTALRFGLPKEQLPHALSLALGSGSATPLQMARIYAAFANGGYLVDPYFVERIESFDGVLIEQTQALRAAAAEDDHPAPRVMSPVVHYLMHSVLQDVVRRGTAQSAMELKRSDLAGKTGTTNEQRDTWFNGYTPALTAVTWIGFDASTPLGEGETGGHTALPMWIDFMRHALNGIPEQNFPQPEGIVSVRINRQTGAMSEGGDDNAAFEQFDANVRPPLHAPILPSAEIPLEENADTDVDSFEEPVQTDMTPSLPHHRSGSRDDDNNPSLF